MKRELLIEAVGSEARIAVLEDDNVVDLIVERDAGASLVGNIYLGRVQRVVTGIGAAFVDIGLGRAGFLPLRNGEMVTEGAAVRVQVARDAFGEKGPQISLNPTLPGRLLVYAPAGGRMAVSRQIEDENERERLLSIVENLAMDEEGFIVRTVAEGATEIMMAEEAENLRDAWENVIALQNDADAPAVLYQDIDLLQKALRDHAQEDVSAIYFDDAGALADAREFSFRFAPGLVDRLQLHSGPVSLFDSREVDEAVEAALVPRVSLPSGGGLVIEATEALTAVDVNSGRFTQGTDPADSARRTNLEAADEVARQIRLRNIGGVIVVDFIDMEDEEGWQEILDRLTQGFVTDRIHCRVVGRTEAGLVELIRRRRRRPLSEILFMDCDVCEGLGLQKNAETAAFDVLRALRREVSHGAAGPLTLCVNPEVDRILANMEDANGENPLDCIGRRVTVCTEPDYANDEYDIYVDDGNDGDGSLMDLSESDG
jgi:ribonuclease G